jgi:hypothetical protein
MSWNCRGKLGFRKTGIIGSNAWKQSEEVKKPRVLGGVGNSLIPVFQESIKFSGTIPSAYGFLYVFHNARIGDA